MRIFNVFAALLLILGCTIPLSLFGDNSTFNLTKLSVLQDLYDAKAKKALSLSQIKIAENDLEKKQRLFEQEKAIWINTPNAISEYDFRQSEMTVRVSDFALKEAQALDESAKAGITLYETLLKAVEGGKMTNEQISGAYSAHWEARRKAAQFAVLKCEEELKFAHFDREMTRNLFAKNVDTKKNLIESEHNFTRAHESLQRAKILEEVSIEAMNKFKVK